MKHQPNLQKKIERNPFNLFRNLIISLLSIAICFGIIACQNKTDLYKREFSPEEKKKLVDQMTNGLLRRYYQGSVAERMVLFEALKLQPKSGDLWREIGVPYCKRGMAAEFEEYYKKAAIYDPVNWQGWRGYIYLYFYRDYKNAIADFDALDPLTPNFVDYPQSTSIHYMRAICYLKLEKYDKALFYFDKHIQEELRTTTEDYIDHKTFLYQGIAHYKKRDFDKAKASMERGIKNIPYNADLWFWSAKLALHFKEKEKAQSALEKAQIQLDKEYNNYRPYVEEFFQIYQSDVEELEKDILYLD